MSRTARYIGYKDDLPNLIKPAIGLRIGCQYLKSLTVKYPKVADAVAAYNAGSPRKNEDGTYVNQAYVDKVSDKFLELTDGDLY